MGQPRHLLRLFSIFSVYFRSFQTNIDTIFTPNQCEKMSIQYTAPGFEPTALRHESSSITTRLLLNIFYTEKQITKERNKERTRKRARRKIKRESMTTTFSNLENVFISFPFKSFENGLFGRKWSLILGQKIHLL